MKKQFTEKDLVDFGNWLMSKERKKLFKSHPCPNGTLKERLSMVHDCDIANFKSLNYKKMEEQKEECKHTSIEEIQGG